MRSRGTLPLVAVAALVAAVSSGCASSARISQFDTFATAGRQYATAMDRLLTESADVMVDTNSRKLLWTAQPLSEAATTPAEREQVKTLLETSLAEQDAVMRLNLNEIALLRAQVSVLSTYFGQLAALATTGAPEQFGEQMANSVTALNNLSNELRGSPLTSKPEAAQQLAKGLGSLIVKGIQQRALETELQARKTTIAEVLRLHQALLAVIRAQIESDLRIVRQRNYEVRVQGAILASVDNQEGWIEDRRSLLGPTPVSQHVGATIGALDKMQTAWAKLLASELSVADVQAVVDDLQPVLSGLASLRSD